MKNVHSDRWKGKKLREIYASKLKDIPDGYIFKLYQILYKSNQKNGNNYSTVGFISFTGDKYKIGYCDNFSRKEFHFDFPSGMYLVSFSSESTSKTMKIIMQ